MVKSKRDLVTPRRRTSITKNRGIVKALSRPASAVPSSEANIKVVVRVRPPNHREQAENLRNVVKIVDEQMLIFDPKEDDQPFYYHGVQQRNRDFLKKANKDLQFVFDRVFNNISTNDEVFECSTQSLIKALMKGYNCSVFAYGATGAGKTFTMIGNLDSPGITYLTMEELFKAKNELSAERDFHVGITYIEVYNELVKDLLNPGPPLQLREDSKYGVVIAGIKFHTIQSPDELFKLLEQGNRCRTQHPTDANAESSRSHAVFQVYLQMTMKGTGEQRSAKLSMIDLAGSERGSATGFGGARFTEGANINKSLLALGNCINSLADGHRHVPYRDSKLTRLLKDSLGGNCQTVMIANVSPSALSFEDTYNTLKYALRAKKIKSHMKKNIVSAEMHVGQYVKLVEELQDENKRLKTRLDELNRCNKELKKDNDKLQTSFAVNRDKLASLDKLQTSIAVTREKLASLDKLQTSFTVTRDNLASLDKPQTSFAVTRDNLASLDKPQTSFAVTSDNVTPLAERAREDVATLVSEKKELLEREFQLQSSEVGMDLRSQLKQERDSRLSGIFINSPELRTAHRKINDQVSRFHKKNAAIKTQLDRIAASKTAIDEKIREIVGEYPQLKSLAEMEDAKLQCIEYQNKAELERKLKELLLDDHKEKCALLEKMALLLKPCYMQIVGHRLAPSSLVKQYNDLVTDFQGRRNITWDSEIFDSGVSSSTSLASLPTEDGCQFTVETSESVHTTKVIFDNKENVQTTESQSTLDSTFSLKSPTTTCENVKNTGKAQLLGKGLLGSKSPLPKKGGKSPLVKRLDNARAMVGMKTKGVPATTNSGAKLGQRAALSTRPPFRS